MPIFLRNTNVFAKRSASQDIAFLRPDPPPANIAESAEKWLAAHLDSGNLSSVVLLRNGQEWWLMRAVTDSGTDSVGRLLSHLIVGRVEARSETGSDPANTSPINPPNAQGSDDTLDAPTLCRFLHAAHAMGQVTRDMVNETPLRLPELTDADPEEAQRSSLALALGRQTVVVVKRPGTAAAVVAALGTDFFDYLVLYPNNVPRRMPEGIGAIISMVHAPLPADIQFVPPARFPAGLSLAGLARLAALPARRMALFRIALALPAATPVGSLPAIDDGDAGAGFSDEELLWLLEIPSSRKLALERATAVQVSNLLDQKRINADELDLVADRLPLDGGPRIATLLVGHDDAMERFLRRFRPGSPGVERLLSTPQQSLWAALQGGRSAKDTWTEQDLVALDRAGLLERLSLKQVVGLKVMPLTSTGSSSSFASLFARWLNEQFVEKVVAEGLPREVVFALMAGTDPSPIPPPVTRMNVDWVAAIDPHRLVECGRWAAQSPQWRLWWRNALAAHPLQPPVPDMELAAYSSSNFWLLRGMIIGREINRDVVFRIIARWNEQLDLPRSWPRDIKLLLETAAVPQNGIIAMLLRPLTGETEAGEFEGFGDKDSLSQSHRDVLNEIFQEKLIPSSAAVEAVLRGAPTQLLLNAGFNIEAVALLNLTETAPPSPPRSWAELLDPVLSDVARRPQFWRRWPGGMNESMVLWLQERLSACAAGIYVQALLDARASKRALSLQELQMVAAALPVSAICRQIIFRLCMDGIGNDTQADVLLDLAGPDSSNSSGATSAIQLLCATPSIRPELAAWLRGECQFGPSSSPPRLAVCEMTALVPLLHPVRDVLRPVLLNTQIEEGEEELLAALLPRLSVAQVVAIPPPEPVVCRRRPDWIDALARLPGWESWRRSVPDAAAKQPLNSIV